DGIRDFHVTGVQTCALPIYSPLVSAADRMEFLIRRFAAHHGREDKYHQTMTHSGLVSWSPQWRRRESPTRFTRSWLDTRSCSTRSEERRVGKEGRAECVDV